MRAPSRSSFNTSLYLSWYHFIFFYSKPEFSVVFLIFPFNHLQLLLIPGLFLCVFVYLKKDQNWCFAAHWLPSLGWSSIHHCPKLSPCCLFGLLRERMGNSLSFVNKYIRAYCSLPWVLAHLFPNSLLHGSNSNITLNPSDNSTVNDSTEKDKNTSVFFHFEKLLNPYPCYLNSLWQWTQQ